MPTTTAAVLSLGFLQSRIRDCVVRDARLRDHAGVVRDAGVFLDRVCVIMSAWFVVWKFLSVCV